jgi:hypothetical protein
VSDVRAKFDGATLAVITAMLTGSDMASAEGISVTSPSPIQNLCRQLVARGYGPNRPLHAYRGSTLALRIRSIGEGAQLEIRGDGVGFRRPPKLGASPPIAPDAPVRARHRARRETVS